MIDNARILLYFYDANLASLLSEFLVSHGIVTFMLDYSGNVVSRLQNDNYSALIMEYNEAFQNKLSDIAGIRLQDAALPIIVVAPAETDSNVAITAYENGADLLLRRSFSLDELLLRLKILIANSNNSTNSHDEGQPIHMGTLLFDAKNRTITTPTGNTLSMTPTESLILQILTSATGNIVSRSMLLRSIWHNDNLTNTAALDVYITRLRHLLSADSNLAIYNMRSRGYRLVITSTDGQK